jgi:hypothetical protein
LERVLKAVGDFTSTWAASDLDVLPVGPSAMALIWRDSLGLLGGSVGDGVDISGVLFFELFLDVGVAIVPPEPRWKGG